MRRVVDVSDLTHRAPPVPYSLGGRDPRTGVDCFWCVLEVNRRLGWALPPEADLDPSWRPHEVPLESYLSRSRGLWERLPGLPRRVGEWAHWRIPGAQTCAVAVEAAPGRVRLLTAMPGLGLRIIPATMLRGLAPSTFRFSP